jgi:mortality factor 4-like protein 1
VQYADIRKLYVTGPTVKVGEEKDMSSIYGAEHFLRMIGMYQIPAINAIGKLQRKSESYHAVSLPAMIGGSNMDPETVNVLRDYVHELMTCVQLTVSSL